MQEVEERAYSDHRFSQSLPTAFLNVRRLLQDVGVMKMMCYPENTSLRKILEMCDPLAS